MQVSVKHTCLDLGKGGGGGGGGKMPHCHESALL